MLTLDTWTAPDHVPAASAAGESGAGTGADEDGGAIESAGSDYEVQAAG